MEPGEVRYRLVSALLQAEEPLTARELAALSGVKGRGLSDALRGLAAEGLVVEGRFLAGKAAPQYGWAARWAREAERRSADHRHELQERVGTGEPGAAAPAVDSPAATAFCDYVLNEYRPPVGKRFLVFYQCSVRRPFSTSPSHGTINRAVTAATGFHPRRDFESCPVHVVVLASKVGPVPYELEDVYPANVRGGGVKDFGPEHYARVRPVLAERMAGYITNHGPCYEHMATFTDSRYGEVMADAARLAGVGLPVLPVPHGAGIVRRGGSRPRKYWDKLWIQLYLEIVARLEPDQQAAAAARLHDMGVEYADGASPK